MKRTCLTFATMGLILFLSCNTLPAADECALDVRPNQITIGTNYNGTTLTLTGTVPDGCDAAVRVLGKLEDERFKQKAKAFGLLWMNMGTVNIHDVPDVLLLAVDSDVYAGGGPAWRQLGLGFESFKGETDRAVFDEFLKLKTHEGLYRIQKDTISYAPVENGRRRFRALLKVPSALHKGLYQVQVFAIRDGGVVCTTSHEVHSELSGFPALLSSVAYGHALLYGIAAALIAIMAGLVMSVLFKGSGGAH